MSNRKELEDKLRKAEQEIAEVREQLAKVDAQPQVGDWVEIVESTINSYVGKVAKVIDDDYYAGRCVLAKSVDGNYKINHGQYKVIRRAGGTGLEGDTFVTHPGTTCQFLRNAGVVSNQVFPKEFMKQLVEHFKVEG